LAVGRVSVRAMSRVRARLCESRGHESGRKWRAMTDPNLIRQMRKRECGLTSHRYRSAAGADYGCTRGA
jgi:hypothetical protein